MKQVHVLIEGQVQGVGYRQFVKHNARKLDLLGWVRNTSDNRVEAVLTGNEEQIRKLIELCKKGPFLADVKRVDVKWENASNELTDFVIRPSE